MIAGVKANDYNATYEETLFDVIPRSGVYEIREVDSGITFFIDKGAFNDTGRSEERTATVKRHGKRY